MDTLHIASAQVARINGIPLNALDETLTVGDLRQRACTELLRQKVLALGLLSVSDEVTPDGVISEAAARAIDEFLERELSVPEPSEEECRRNYLANQSQYQTGERVSLRHILFAVTPGMNVTALRSRAEAILLDVRSHDGKGFDGFGDAARSLSNCPSGAEGGALGWLTQGDCAPEFAREIFGHAEVGVLSRLVHSRFGLHVVEVQAREAGVMHPFEAVRGAVANSLRQQTYVTALRQYLHVLAGEADVEGVDLESAETPLVQ